MIKQRSNWWGYALGMISGITYGMNPLFGVPVLKKGLDVISLLFYRYGIAVLLMLAFMLATRKSLKISMKQFLMMLLGQHPSGRTWISIFTGVAGAVLLSFNGEGGFIDWRGIVLVVLSGLSYSFFIIIVNQSKLLKSMPNLTLTFYCFLVGSMELFLFMRCGLDLNPVPDAVSWWNVIGLAVLPTTVATITLAAASKSIGPTKTSVMGILEPLTAIVVGTMVFHELFTVHIGIGIALILFSILFMVLSKAKKLV